MTVRQSHKQAVTGDFVGTIGNPYSRSVIVFGEGTVPSKCDIVFQRFNFSQHTFALNCLPITDNRIDRFLDRVFGGSDRPALLHFVRESDLSPEEVAEIERLLEGEGGEE